MAGHRLAEATPSFERLRPAARATTFRLERVRERGGFSQTANNDERPRERAASERDPFTRVPFLAGALPDRGRRRALTFAPVPIFTRVGSRIHALAVPMFAVIGAQSHRAGRRRRSNVHDRGFGFQDCHVQTHLIGILGRAVESLPGLPVMLNRGENRVGLRSRESAPARSHEGRERCGHHGPPTDAPRGTRNVTRAIRALVFVWRSPACEAVSETSLPRHRVLTFRFRSHSYLHLVRLQLESGSAPCCSPLDDVPYHQGRLMTCQREGAQEFRVRSHERVGGDFYDE